jgi:hypothetical protein
VRLMSVPHHVQQRGSGLDGDRCTHLHNVIGAVDEKKKIAYSFDSNAQMTGMNDLSLDLAVVGMI